MEKAKQLQNQCFFVQILYPRLLKQPINSHQYPRQWVFLKQTDLFPRVSNSKHKLVVILGVLPIGVGGVPWAKAKRTSGMGVTIIITSTLPQYVPNVVMKRDLRSLLCLPSIVTVWRVVVVVVIRMDRMNAINIIMKRRVVIHNCQTINVLENVLQTYCKHVAEIGGVGPQVPIAQWPCLAQPGKVLYRPRLLTQWVQVLILILDTCGMASKTVILLKVLLNKLSGLLNIPSKVNYQDCGCPGFVLPIDMILLMWPPIFTSPQFVLVYPLVCSVWKAKQMV